ncbi:MAG: nitroreductase [Thermoprotei archaeon]|nr:MAG: nitroreductase [Thermoprotei archaeon]
MDVLEAIRRRRSVRRYEPREVEDEKLHLLLEAARLAPSADNRQPWRFIVVKSREVKERLFKAHGKAWLVEAPVIIVGCAVPSEAWRRRDGEEYWKVDVAIAMEHIALAATSLGLATCWVASFNEEGVKEALGLPGEVRVVALMSVGYPAELKGEVSDRRSLDEITCLDRWCWR